MNVTPDDATIAALAALVHELVPGHPALHCDPSSRQTSPAPVTSTVSTAKKNQPSTSREASRVVSARRGQRACVVQAGSARTRRTTFGVEAAWTGGARAGVRLGQQMVHASLGHQFFPFGPRGSASILVQSICPCALRGKSGSTRSVRVSRTLKARTHLPPVANHLNIKSSWYSPLLA
jgi:hypothetical protein